MVIYNRYVIELLQYDQFRLFYCFHQGEVSLIRRLFPAARPQRILIRASLSPGTLESTATHLSVVIPAARGTQVPSAANKQRVRKARGRSS